MQATVLAPDASAVEASKRKAVNYEVSDASDATKIRVMICSMLDGTVPLPGMTVCDVIVVAE